MNLKNHLDSSSQMDLTVFNHWTMKIWPRTSSQSSNLMHSQKEWTRIASLQTLPTAAICIWSSIMYNGLFITSRRTMLTSATTTSTQLWLLWTHQIQLFTALILFRISINIASMSRRDSVQSLHIWLACSKTYLPTSSGFKISILTSKLPWKKETSIAFGTTTVGFWI